MNRRNNWFSARCESVANQIQPIRSQFIIRDNRHDKKPKGSEREREREKRQKWGSENSTPNSCSGVQLNNSSNVHTSPGTCRWKRSSASRLSDCRYLATTICTDSWFHCGATAFIDAFLLNIWSCVCVCVNRSVYKSGFCPDEPWDQQNWRLIIVIMD